MIYDSQSYDFLFVGTQVPLSNFVAETKDDLTKGVTSYLRTIWDRLFRELTRSRADDRDVQNGRVALERRHS